MRRAVQRCRVAAVLVVLLPLANFAGPPAKLESVSLELEDGVLKLTFDSSRVAAATVRQLITFSPRGIPYAKALATPITVCVPEEREYRPCGSRDIHAPNFLANAEVNLRKNKTRMSTLQQIPPNELDSVFSHLKAFLAFTTWLEQIKYEFAKSWDPQVLRRKYETLDAGELCPAVLNEVDTATSKDAKWKLVSYDWHNCLIQAFRKHNGEYPKAAWDQFLVAYGIKETFSSTVE